MIFVSGTSEHALLRDKPGLRHSMPWGRRILKKVLDAETLAKQFEEHPMDVDSAPSSSLVLASPKLAALLDESEVSRRGPTLH